MVTIHEYNTTEYNSLGLGALLPSSCIVKEELNGCYEVELTHPYDKTGKWERLVEGRIIVASTPSGSQPFRIYRIHPDMGEISVYARHIFYDLLDNGIESFSVKNGTAKNFLAAVKYSMLYEMSFEFETDIELSGTAKLTSVNPIQAILSNEDKTDSFVKLFGGELLRDGYLVSMQMAIGRDRDVAIRYGKNLIGLEVDEDISSVKTRIICKNNRYREVYDSPYIDHYTFPKIHMLYDGSKTIAALREEAKTMLDGGCDLPKVNIKVDFVELTKTEEYKDYAVLEEVFLGDLVTVINAKMGFRKKAKVISYEWDCLLNRYGKIELGDFMATIATSVTSGMSGGTSAAADASNVLTLLNEHLENKENPHEVTAEQVGASGETGGSGLPVVTTDDNGKVLIVVNGAWTAGTIAVPYSETSNDAGGTTVVIGDEMGV